MVVPLDRPRSASGDNFDDFEAIAGPKLALGKFRRGDGLAVVFDDDAAGEEVLGNEKPIEWAREVALYPAAIGDDEGHFLVKTLKR